MGILTPPYPQKIIVLRSLQFGDLLCTVPAFRALRAALPEAEIHLIGLPWAAGFVQRYSQYLDRFIEFQGFPGFPEQEPRIRIFPSFLEQVQAEQYDLAIQMQGSGNISNSLIELLGAKKTAGFCLEGAYCPDQTSFMSYPVGEHEIWRHLRLMEFLGIPLMGDELEFPISETEWQAFNSLHAELDLREQEYIVIHPGARAPERRWAPEKFAALADNLAEDGFQIVLTGTSEEEEIVLNVIRQMAQPAVNACGRTTQGTLGALLVNARLLISNDTGVSHLAAALHIPSVVLFSDSEPERWAPLNSKLHRRVLWASAAQPSTVLEEAEQVLEQAHAS